jgi:YD repeat-containing protein
MLQNQVGETYSVTVYVTDGRDEPVSTTFTVTVTADTATPVLVIGFTPTKANMNGTVTVVVSATDNVGITETSLRLKSVRKPSGEVVELNETFKLDATGRVNIPLNEKYIGVLLFEATAIDAAGNIGTKTSEYLVTDPRDTKAANITLLPVSSDGKVYGPVDVRGVYNALGQKISETNQLGLTRTFEYNKDGLLTAVELPVTTDPITGQLIYTRYEYGYDQYGRQILIRDPNGYETRFTYDMWGNQLSRTLPLGYGDDGVQGTADDILATGNFTEYFKYDGNGQLILHTSFEGIVTEFRYNNLGQLIEKRFYENETVYNNGAGTEYQLWTYQYDTEGRLTQINQDGCVTITEYDSLGNIKSIQSPEGTVYYEYDKLGRQTRVYTDAEEDIRYEYDILGRLATVIDVTKNETTTYEYDLVGNLYKIIYSNGSVAIHEYDNMNRLVKLSNFVDANNNNLMDDGEGVSQFTYTLDDLGRKIRALEQFWADFGNDYEEKNQQY